MCVVLLYRSPHIASSIQNLLATCRRRQRRRHRCAILATVMVAVCLSRATPNIPISSGHPQDFGLVKPMYRCAMAIPLKLLIFVDI
ncbi:hypothetical protein Y032_0099g3218 [Ancylostoma ceylanicum]|uniref:Uncharacterized protein n=1 Tax=Ancylostoma ceylanicum TaxID=53326 RepID=A0A016TIX6_9BILA|nr:hypothetical protein Y032_0099g3218 [Ancylostoma ceylanicum]